MSHVVDALPAGASRMSLVFEAVAQAAAVTQQLLLWLLLGSLLKSLTLKLLVADSEVACR